MFLVLNLCRCRRLGSFFLWVFWQTYHWGLRTSINCCPKWCKLRSLRIFRCHRTLHTLSLCISGGSTRIVPHRVKLLFLSLNRSCILQSILKHCLGNIDDESLIFLLYDLSVSLSIQSHFFWCLLPKVWSELWKRTILGCLSSAFSCILGNVACPNSRHWWESRFQIFISDFSNRCRSLLRSISIICLKWILLLLIFLNWLDHYLWFQSLFWRNSCCFGNKITPWFLLITWLFYETDISLDKVAAWLIQICRWHACTALHTLIRCLRRRWNCIQGSNWSIICV